MTEFKLSRYVKEELPTWAEMHEWYQNQFYDYIPPAHKEPLDPYWKIPKRLYTLASVCNQLNKMLLEDEYIIGLINTLHDEFEDLAIDDIYFAIHIGAFHNVDKNTIYTWDTKPNPFISDSSTRQMVNPSLHSSLVVITHQSKDLKAILTEEEAKALHSRIIEFMFMEIERYYTEPIGWKDEKGNPSIYRKKPFVCPSGFDPAL